MKNLSTPLSIAISFILFFISNVASAHTVAYDFSEMSNTGIGFVYMKMGFLHILPLGLDHILFILGIFLLQPRLKTIFWQVTAFTVAHSLTLGLAIYGYIKPVSSVVEPIIALSIVFVAIENIMTSDLKWWRVIIIFLFGLIHGCGFAGVLMETGLPQNNYLLALLSFNVGVEVGQLSVILIAYYLFGKWFMHKSWYRNRVTIPISVCIALVAFYWTFERIVN